jgi:DNA mismatch endonuclease (patch repair protein)
MTRADYKPKSRKEIAKNMAAIRSRDNQTEEALRKALFKMGYRYRKYVKGLSGCPDIVFPKQKIAVFVDGDFWHARSLKEGGPEGLQAKLKTANKAYWTKKFERRMELDRSVNEKLASQGWCVLRFWEGDIKGDLTSALSIITYNLETRIP